MGYRQDVGVVIHTIPETVGMPIINAREASDLSVTIRPSESYVRKVCPDSVIKITKGSREIRLITASTTTRMTVWFLVEPEETGATGPTGEKGEQDEKGDKGDTDERGEKGEKGDTPVKGVDYFTDSDIDDIVEKMLICINGNGVAY